MSKIRPDYSFERDGIGLKEWLWKLLDEDRAVRATAGNAMQAIMRGLPDIHTDLRLMEPFPDWSGQLKRFKRAVHEAATSQGFDKHDYIFRLCAFRFSLSNDWADRVTKSTTRGTRDAKFERVADQLVDKINTTTDDTTKQHAIEHFARLARNYVCGGCEENSVFGDAESMAMSGLASGTVFSALADELVKFPDALVPLFRSNRSDLLKVFAEAGRAAIGYAPMLLADLDSLPTQRSEYISTPDFDACTALAAVAKGDPHLAQALMDRLSPTVDVAIRIAASSTIEQMEADVCGRNEEIAELLLPETGPELMNGTFLRAMGSVGRDMSRIRAYLIDCARVRAPVLRSPEGFPQYPIDITMSRRGIAISAFAYCEDYADEFTATLLDAIDTFEEFDPDVEYYGPIARVAFVVRAFGPKADPILARALAAHLADDDEEYPKAILRSLASMGASARDVLPQLESYWLARSDGLSLDELDGKEVDDFGDLAGWAIQQIRKAIQ